MCRSHRRASNQFSYSLYGNPIGFTETSMIKRPDEATLELPMRPRLCAGRAFHAIGCGVTYLAMSLEAATRASWSAHKAAPTGGLADGPVKGGYLPAKGGTPNWHRRTRPGQVFPPAG